MYDSLVTTLCGRCTCDPTMATTKNQEDCINFAMAINHAEGKVTFASVNCYGRAAEIARRNLAKGDRVTVVGEAELIESEKTGRAYLRINAYRIFPGAYVPSSSGQDAASPPPKEKEDEEYV